MTAGLLQRLDSVAGSMLSCPTCDSPLFAIGDGAYPGAP